MQQIKILRPSNSLVGSFMVPFKVSMPQPLTDKLMQYCIDYFKTEDPDEEPDVPEDLNREALDWATSTAKEIVGPEASDFEHGLLTMHLAESIRETLHKVRSSINKRAMFSKIVEKSELLTEFEAELMDGTPLKFSYGITS